MGWDAIIIGELTFPPGAVAKWRASKAVAVDFDWPPMIAQAIFEPDDDDDVLTVAEVLENAADHDAFGGIEVTKDRMRVRYVVDGGSYSAVGNDLVGLLSAASHVGASGRMLFCDASNAQSSGFFFGGLVLLDEGEIEAEKMNEPLERGDREKIFELVNEMLAHSKKAQAERVAAKAGASRPKGAPAAAPKPVAPARKTAPAAKMSAKATPKKAARKTAR